MKTKKDKFGDYDISSKIKKEVYENHLSIYPNEEEIVKPFLNGFSITWAGRRRKLKNTELSAYLLKPDNYMSMTFGFEQEMLLIYSPYRRMEPRTLLASEAILEESQIKARVETLSYILVSEDENVKEWIDSYLMTHQEEPRVVIVISAVDLRKNKNDSYYLRNIISKQLFMRDLFDYKLPLIKDIYFFGRKEIINNFFDAIKRGENRGLFGLRKTGKTSILFKLERLVIDQNIAEILYYDCKSPSIRNLRWFQLLEKICKDISGKLGIRMRPLFDEAHIADTLNFLVERSNKKIVIIFDEIEYISPLASMNPHWNRDFIDFWQTFWHVQSRHRNISAIVAGINPYSVEVSSIQGIQNPLFGIVTYEFLKGLKYDEMKTMLKTLGRRMGIQFEPGAVDYIHNRYGGHPFLTRILCSKINQSINLKSINKPYQISYDILKAEEENRESDLMFYCEHVVSELRQFYPDEYKILELIASHQIYDVLELVSNPGYARHLKDYGLYALNANNIPEITIPVIDKFIGLDSKIQEGRKTVYKIVDKTDRSAWIERRKDDILNEFRFLEKLISSKSAPSLFGTNSFPEADKFKSILICNDLKDFEVFINICNRCFVESIENYGKSNGNSNYLFTDIKNAYPELLKSLRRIKIYRHNSMHILLYPNVTNNLIDFLKVDLEGNDPNKVEDLAFMLQQCTIDGLLIGLHVEITKLSS